MLIDTHTHLTDPRFADDLDSVIASAAAAGVGKMIVCGYDLPSSRAAVGLAEKYSILFATVGVHPHDARTWDRQSVEIIQELCHSEKVIAVGETGLDYHYNHSPRADQVEVFHKHIELAIEMNMPLVVHCREAMKETLSVLREFAGRLPRTVFHCFSGDEKDLEAVLALGCWIGVDGPVTFPASKTLRQVVAECPRDRLLLETDCPYLAPVPFRGKRNEPSYLTYIAQEVARVWGISDSHTAEVTTANAMRLFCRL